MTPQKKSYKTLNGKSLLSVKAGKPEESFTQPEARHAPVFLLHFYAFCYLKTFSLGLLAQLSRPNLFSSAFMDIRLWHVRLTKTEA